MTTVERDQHGRVYVEPQRPQFVPPAAFVPRYPVSLREILAFAAELETAGFDTGQRIKAAGDVAAAIEAAYEPPADTYWPNGLLDLTAEQVTTRARQRLADIAAIRSNAGQVLSEFRDRLAADVAEALNEQSSAIIAGMRPAFDKALAVVQAAVDAGLIPTSTADDVVASGHTKQMAAFRALPEAVATLDGIARLRDQLTQTCDVGPWQWPFAAYLAEASLADIEGAQGHDDVIETRTSTATSPWPITVREVVHRTGGRWLALIVAGHRLTLNDGREAEAVVDRARQAQTEA